MLDNEKNPLIAIAENSVKSEQDKAQQGNKNLSNISKLIITPSLINRHGVITGATGTGKTVSLQTLAETFSELGIPVFMADVKGDLSGIAKAGTIEGKIGERVKMLGLEEEGYKSQAFPVCFWDVFGENGHPLRATISELGPILLGRILGLNEVQEGVLNIVFRIADDNGLLLLDLKDLRAMVTHVGEEREQYRAKYGQISPASIGAIQRALLRLEDEAGSNFFGEPALDIDDLLQTQRGKGIINILDATKLINTPTLYSCILLWLLSELFERLPEVGDQAKPKLAFFFDEAHLLFDDISAPLLQKIEQMARLIRSRGVGIYFVSQNPADIPDNILGQLGNRIQHALRAFTPKDQKAVKAAAQAFRPNPEFSTVDVIGQLGVGEALVSFLDVNGVPQIVQKALIIPPQSQVGVITQAERNEIIRNSLVAGIYEKSIDRESAYEILAERTKQLQAAKEAEIARKQQEKEAKKNERAAKANPDPISNILGSLVKQTTRAASNAVGRQIGNTILRGIMGGLFGGKR